jgi:hypothetical protein
VFFDIVQPEVMALSVGVAGARAANALHLVQQKSGNYSDPIYLRRLSVATLLLVA